MMSGRLVLITSTFQVMPPRGGNLLIAAPARSASRVSSHAPARGQLLYRRLGQAEPGRFKSCPREGATE